MERQSLYEKISQLTWQQQLGNLASTLAKISTQATEPSLDKLTSYLLREAALIIEWSAKNVPQQFHLELAAIQKECLEWKKVFPIEDARIILSINTRYHSHKILHIAGLLEDDQYISSQVETGKMPVPQFL